MTMMMMISKRKFQTEHSSASKVYLLTIYAFTFYVDHNLSMFSRSETVNPSFTLSHSR
jgi:hypothetical protein